MERSRDRISNLSDPILETILSLIPLKCAIRTSVLSKRWRGLWVHNLFSSTALDFGENFSSSQFPDQFVAILNRYLQLYNGGNKLESFRVLFAPFDIFLPDIESWVAFAANQKVLKLNLDLSLGYRDPRNGGINDGRGLFRLPNCIYSCDFLTHLNLSRCELWADPSSFSSLGRALQSLSLSYVNITDDMVHSLLNHCLLLESLSLKNCEHLVDVEITRPGLRLQRLVVGDCWGGYTFRVAAQKLISIHYFGNLFFHNYFIDVSSLDDASICSIGRGCAVDRDYVGMLRQVSHVRFLTLCTATLTNVATMGESNQLPNLQELQLLMDSMTDEYLTCIYYFFRLCPSPLLEKFFIQLPRSLEDQIDITYAVEADLKPPDVAFNHLKMIKLGNFKGSRNEMRLVKFFLEKAIILESLVLVAPQMSDQKDLKRIKERMGLRILRGQLSLLPKASPEVCIVLCEFEEDDGSLIPSHKDHYYDYSYLSEASGYTFDSEIHQIC